jgi:hypothetical protein
VTPISKLGPAILHVPVSITLDLPNLDFGKLGSASLCSFFILGVFRVVSRLPSSFLTTVLLYPPTSANQENMTPSTLLKLKIPGKSAQAHTKLRKPKAPPKPPKQMK